MTTQLRGSRALKKQAYVIAKYVSANLVWCTYELLHYQTLKLFVSKNHMKSRSSHAVFKTLAQSAEPCSENMKTVAKHCELHNNRSSSQLRKPLLVLLYVVC